MWHVLSIALLGALLSTPPLAGQLRGEEQLRVVGTDGTERSIPVSRTRGFPSIPLSALRAGGVDASESGSAGILIRVGGAELLMREWSPFVSVGGTVAQLVDPVFREGGELHVPAHLLTGLLPEWFPSALSLDAGRLRILPPANPVAAAPRPAQPSTVATPPAPAPSPPPSVSSPTPPRPNPPPADQLRVPGASARKVVVIDPGHGGGEPGAVGPGGTLEKEISLGIALALAAELRRDPQFEVHLTRQGDELVPLWDRGDRATQWKGERPGVFVSIHANSVPDRRSVRGFETYFLAEARTDDARRVAALENASPFRPEGAPGAGGDPDLGSILNELRLLDHQHWSALLAEFIQQELARFHPGPNRGVKQGPFAVLTNALMPSVLVEIGFISNQEEERLMLRSDFQRETAQALSGAVRRFFQRYPPGSGPGEEVDR
jgi:N-acetylmuramoyl-L-alanine amidase